MLLASLFIAIATTPAPRPVSPLDFDTPKNIDRTSIDSAYLQDQVTSAMALPYKFGVTQMPCKAWQMQPSEGWAPAREPSGKIAWSIGSTTSVKWAGIYGTCSITAPFPRELMGEAERAALECQCNGWLPRGIRDYPQP